MRAQTLVPEIIFVAALPPPRTGASTVNFSCLELLRDSGLNVTAFDTSPKTKCRNFTYHLRRAVRFSKALWKIYTCTRPAILYVSLARGWAAAYDVVLILSARLRAIKIVVHHHSTGNLIERSLRQRLLQYALSSSRQIVLCRMMAALVKASYDSRADVRIITNASFYRWDGATTPRKSLLRVGYLGPYTASKGFDRFLGMAASLRDRGIKLEFHCAGDDPASRSEFSAAGNPKVHELISKHWGFVEGDEKKKFFTHIDTLIYPSREDAEPLTVIEALAAGVPVVSTNVGCVSELLEQGGGYVTDWTDLANVVEYLIALHSNPSLVRHISLAALAASQKRHTAGQEGRREFLSLFSI